MPLTYGNITLKGIGNSAGAGATLIGNASTDKLDLAGTFFTGGDTTYTSKTGKFIDITKHQHLRPELMLITI